MNAKELTERITLQQKSVTRNAIGEEVVSWVEVCKLWAKVMPLRGNAFFTANQQQHTVDARFMVRARSGLSVDMRIVWKSLNYDITNLIPGTDQYRGWLELHAINGVNNGR